MIARRNIVKNLQTTPTTEKKGLELSISKTGGGPGGRGKKVLGEAVPEATEKNVLGDMKDECE